MKRNGKVWIAAGTTEGRRLAEFCRKCHIQAIVTVVTSYGGELIQEGDCLTVQEGALSEQEMEAFIQRENIDWVVDATHPFAREVTENIRCASTHTKIRYTRCLRKDEVWDGEAAYEHLHGIVRYVEDAQKAAEFLAHTTGNIFLTTGSRDLGSFAKMEGFTERVYARVLPASASLEACFHAGLSGKHIICMQGPFSKDLNREMFRAVQTQWIVTKETGSVGGFWEKIAAAEELGLSIVVIGRPKETGVSVEECERLLGDRIVKQTENGGFPCKLCLIGAGMGTEGTKTREAEQWIEKSQVVFGAGRSLAAWEKEIESKQVVHVYQPEAILTWLKEHPQTACASVLYSGDSGFYSGAAALIQKEKEEREAGRIEREYHIECFPGISSLAYLCAKCLISWEGTQAVSLHGRECDLKEFLKKDQNVFLLLDKNHTPDGICRYLAENGMGERYVHIGEKLSYPEERIVSGQADTMTEIRFDLLSVILIEKDSNAV